MVLKTKINVVNISEPRMLQANPADSSVIRYYETKSNMKKANFVERRHGPDFRIKFMRVLTIFAWSILLLSLLTFEYARPELVPGYAKYKGLEELFRAEWDITLSNLLFSELLLCCLISVVTIVLSQTRLKRATDRQKFNQIFVFIVSITACVYVWLEILG
ncbi:hypothetical protein C2869_14420 [Saccharobesus litoralis]|uniref:Uncharacterized protein n=1 Tax=Saccharobesus litoralis TaxID=2172099 RepID=A0A2S0VTZ3_9ALTE|nr:hypothetical protein [Saccharobesus litoralis]AWB67560.1 hypothetical protein C2869_14420 [Saccharobesus litoralis]